MTQLDALLLTGDESLRDHTVRLSAAVGANLQVTCDVGSALADWARPPVVLVGADLAAAAADARPARRPGVQLVCSRPAAEGLYRAALAVGAEQVLELPAAEAWVADLLADAVDGGARDALTVGVVGGAGGVGATTFAAALATVAAERQPVTLVDADPLGPGIHRVLGLDGRRGTGWESLAESSGRLSARALREALPRREQLAVLGWAEDRSTELPGPVMAEAVAAAQRGSAVVVVDLPRQTAAHGHELLRRCGHVLVVARLAVPAVAAAQRVVARLADLGPQAHLAARRSPGAAVDPELAAGALDLPLLVTIPDQRGLAEAVDLGLGPAHARRSPLARAARETLSRLTPARA